MLILMNFDQVFDGGLAGSSLMGEKLRSSNVVFNGNREGPYGIQS